MMALLEIRAPQVCRSLWGATAGLTGVGVILVQESVVEA